MVHQLNMNGCRWCDAPELDHARLWHPEHGWHQWQEPTDAQRLERFKEWSAKQGDQAMNAAEARRRQKLIASTLEGLNELLTTNLHQEMDPEQEQEMFRLLGHASIWVDTVNTHRWAGSDKA